MVSVIVGEVIVGEVIVGEVIVGEVIVGEVIVGEVHILYLLKMILKSKLARNLQQVSSLLQVFLDTFLLSVYTLYSTIFTFGKGV